MTATFIPAPARRNAKDGPAWPVPMMIASKSGMTRLSRCYGIHDLGTTKSPPRRQDTPAPIKGAGVGRDAGIADEPFFEVSCGLILYKPRLIDPAGSRK